MFGVCFAAAGFLQATWQSVATLIGTTQKTGFETPATIDSLKLKRVSGDDSDTFKVIGEYRYTFAGKDFKGTRASLYSGSDNIGSYHRDLYERLQADRSAKRAVCFVDPSEPSESTLDRTFRPGMFGFCCYFRWCSDRLA